MTNERPPRLIGYSEIQNDYLPGIPVGTLRNWQSTGKMPAGSIALGRRRVWPEPVIQDWVRGLIEGEAA